MFCTGDALQKWIFPSVICQGGAQNLQLLAARAGTARPCSPCLSCSGAGTASTAGTKQDFRGTGQADCPEPSPPRARENSSSGGELGSEGWKLKTLQGEGEAAAQRGQEFCPLCPHPALWNYRKSRRQLSVSQPVTITWL